MSVAAPSYTSFEDYLLAEASSDIKHEWCHGVVYAMSRGTPEHGRLTMRVARLSAALSRLCALLVFQSRFRTETRAARRMGTQYFLDHLDSETANLQPDGATPFASTRGQG